MIRGPSFTAVPPRSLFGSGGVAAGSDEEAAIAADGNEQDLQILCVCTRNKLVEQDKPMRLSRVQDKFQ